MQIAQLRQATKADHTAAERAMAFMEPGLTLSRYRTALERMYEFVWAWEVLAEATAPTDLQDFVKTRARRALLAADILNLNGDLYSGPLRRLPAFTSPSEFLGALYVMEGSRLGGQFIARHVELTLGLEGGRGTTYFRGFGDHTGAHWKELLCLMASEIPDSESGLTIAAAKAMFHSFGDWMTPAAPLSQANDSGLVGESQDG